MGSKKKTHRSPSTNVPMSVNSGAERMNNTPHPGTNSIEKDD